MPKILYINVYKHFAMTTNEIIILDKWLESAYHLRRMKNKWFENQADNANKSKISKEFKYEFNSFVNSSRSITFILQKCFKNKHADFDSWYNAVREELNQNEFAMTLLEIRNANQKEGNKFPDIIEVRRINDFFNTETTYTPIASDNSSLTDKLNLTNEQKQKLSRNIVDFRIVPNLEKFDINLTYDNKSDEGYEKVLENMGEMLNLEILKIISIKKSEITDEELKNMTKIPSKLKIKNETYSWESFYGKCENLLDFYKIKCMESVKLFT